MSRSSIIEWLDSVRGKPAVKILTGLRGVGKSVLLAQWRTHLLESGVPEERIVCVDMEEPVLRHLATTDGVLAYFRTQLPPDGRVYLLLEEPTSFPNFELVLGSLFALRSFDTYVTVSTRRILSGELSKYLGAAMLYREIMPDDRQEKAPAEQVRARWNEIFLKDVLSGGRLMDAPLAERIAAYLADHMGDPVSLRAIAADVSPVGRLLSPNTVNSYLDALVDANLVEKVYRWDDFAEEPLRTGYRIYFTDPTLRVEHFGPAPENDLRRTNLNRAWLELRRHSNAVFVPKGPDASCDFLMRVNSALIPFRADGPKPVRC